LVAVVVVALVILAIVAAYVFESGGLSSNGSTQFASVTVFGSAVVATPGNSALYLLFTDEGGKVYNATITSSHYSIVLPTNHTYLARLTYLGSQSIIRGSKGVCAVGSITIPSNSGSARISKDWSC
jgi:hypothetical protein